jgi:hypothetical protein
MTDIMPVGILKDIRSDLEFGWTGEKFFTLSDPDSGETRAPPIS